MMFRFPSVITTLCTGFFSLLAIIKASYDLYFTIEDIAVISYLQKKFHTLPRAKERRTVAFLTALRAAALFEYP